MFNLTLKKMKFLCDTTEEKRGINSRIGIFWICPVNSLPAFIIANLHNELHHWNTILPETCYLAPLSQDLPSHDQNKEITWSSTWLTMTQHGEHKHMLTFSLVMVRNQAVPFVYKFGIMLLAHRGTLVHACVVHFRL